MRTSIVVTALAAAIAGFICESVVRADPPTTSPAPAKKPTSIFDFGLELTPETPDAGKSEPGEKPGPNQPAPNQPAPNQPAPNQPTPNQPAPLPKSGTVQPQPQPAPAKPTPVQPVPPPAAQPGGQGVAGDLLTAIHIDDSGVVTADRPVTLGLQGTIGQHFIADGDFFLAPEPTPFSNGQCYFHLRQLDGKHCIDLSVNGMRVKRILFGGEQVGKFSYPMKFDPFDRSKWHHFRIEAGPNIVSVRFDDQEHSIAGATETGGQNHIVFGPGAKLKNLQIQIVNGPAGANGQAPGGVPAGVVPPGAQPAANLPGQPAPGAPAPAAQAPLAAMAPKVLPFPCVIQEIIPAAGGQLLIVYLKQVQQLAVVDVGQGQVIKFIPLPSPDVALTAGAQKLYIGIKDLKQIQRWGLAKLDRELTFPAPPGGIETMAMGADSLGPLVVGAPQHAKRTWLINPVTGRYDPMPSHHWGGDGSAWGPVHIHVSFDGSTIVEAGGGWAGIELVSLVSGHVANLADGGYAQQSDVLVAGNGSLVFLSDNMLRADLNTKVSGISGRSFPAMDPAFSLALEQPKKTPRHSKGSPPAGDGKNALVVFNNGDPRPMLTISNFTELEGGSSLPAEQRVFFVPREKVMVTVGPGDDRLFVRHFDLADALEAQGTDYLFVESAPPGIVMHGQPYKYKVLVRSKKGGVKFTLQAGPRNMTLSKEGVLSWIVPTQYVGDDPSVIIQIEDAGGQQIFHNFRIALNAQQHARARR